jgi:GNAT superfamily N-acetyltransferase
MAGHASELTWVREVDPVWDADKQRVIGGAPEGAFSIPFADRDPLPGEWWSAREGGPDGVVLGYGRLDIGWGGDAQILLAVDPSRQEEGVGSFVLAHLEDEAAARGINHVYNTIRDHEQRDLVHDWLVVRGFRGAVDGDLRKRVGSTPAQPARPPRAGVTPYDVSADPGGRAPGQEEQGGYVDVDEHRY